MGEWTAANFEKHASLPAMNKGNLHLSFLTGIKHVIIFLVLASVSATGATINTFGSEDIQNNAVTIRSALFIASFSISL